jgi:hypothetical protein
MSVQAVVLKALNDPAFAATLQKAAQDVVAKGTAGPEYAALMQHFAATPQQLATFVAAGMDPNAAVSTTTITTTTTATTVGCTFTTGTTTTTC